MYGHSIPWKKVKTTSAILQQVSRPGVTYPVDKSKFKILQSQLFRRRLNDEEPPQFVKKQYWTKKKKEITPFSYAYRFL